MSDVNDAALAGAGEQASVSILDSYEPEAEQQPERRREREPEQHDEGQGDTPDTTSEDDDLVLDGDEGEEPEKATSKPDDDGLDTLRDGTKVSKKDLKEAYENKRNYERDRAAFEAERQAFQQRSERVTQQEQLFQAFIIERMNQLPPEPDPRLAQENPGEFLFRQQQRATAINELQRAIGGHQDALQERRATEAANYEQHIKAEQEALFQKLPELQDPQKREAFHNEMIEGAHHYGFTNEEIASASDHRLMLMIRDANRYRRAVANRGKAAEKAKEAAPMVAPQQPGRRVSASERQAAATREQIARLRKTGSARDAEAFLSNFE